LVGPTGVGKTTTIAKLAAGFQTQTGLRVGLVTIDTFRTGAVEQLRQYSRAMELPLEVAKDGEELGSAMDRLKDSDLVLIDTAGKNPRDQPHLQQLVKLFQAVPPDEVHLVLSAASSPQAAERVLRGFAPVEPTGLILSKLDEVDATAHLLPVLTGGAPPLTYLAHGQNVPDDIQRAEKDLVLEYCF
jgi:flagellar biosynthesis protein FlhF